MRGSFTTAQAARSSVVQLGEVRAEKRRDSVGYFRPSRGDDNTNDFRSDCASRSGVNTAADFAFDAPANVLGRRRPSVTRHWVALAAAFVLHGALVAWFLWREPLTIPGAGGQELEAVSVDIISESALESLSAQPSAAAGGAATVIGQSPGTASAVDQIEVSAPANTAQQNPEPPISVLQAEPLPAPAEAAAAEVANPDPKPKEPERRQDEPKQEPGSDTVQPLAQSAAAAGGAASRSASETITVDGSAGASPGQLTRYAIDVRLAIGRTKPRHDGGRGKVQVSFGLSEAGTVRIAEVARSSGSASLDGASLRAIHRTAFPTPPTGMTNAQRTYVVPFEFK